MGQERASCFWGEKINLQKGYVVSAEILLTNLNYFAIMDNNFIISTSSNSYLVIILLQKNILKLAS